MIFGEDRRFGGGMPYEVVHVDSSLDVSSVESQGSGSINNAFWDDLNVQRGSHGTRGNLEGEEGHVWSPQR